MPRAIGKPLTISIGYSPSGIRWVGAETKTFSTVASYDPFCSSCGTSIGYTDEDSKVKLISIGFIDAHEEFVPQASRLGPAVALIAMGDGMPRVDGYICTRNLSIGNPRAAKSGSSTCSSSGGT
ncbi:Glutathione-dependent formaldehyde-activating GFA (fragment) [Mesorhizobium metallidurans STM 2683]|uniref:Glutathione-dependent formaldehyde-activating GFA n=1 Tax=Mesorhizobium metallidurans STM 2683 TaxID=1297569 RepID=M5EN70_9HYPH